MITDFHVTLHANRSVHWPHFAGSRIRGAFGRALRLTACITGKPDCNGCAMRAHCAYGAVFDPVPPSHPLHPSFQNGLPAYIVQLPPLGAQQLYPGDSAEFSLRLLPGTKQHHNLIEQVLRNAVNQHLFRPGDCTLQKIERTTLIAPEEPSDMSSSALTGIDIQWVTPVRLQHQGKPLFRPQDLSADTLASAAWRRYLQWCQFTRQSPSSIQPYLDAAKTCALETRNLQWHDISRYSNTQQRHLPLGGLIGAAHLTGPDQALKAMLPALRLGELLHIGKETVFGLGRYQLRTRAETKPLSRP